MSTKCMNVYVKIYEYESENVWLCEWKYIHLRVKVYEWVNEYKYKYKVKI